MDKVTETLRSIEQNYKLFQQQQFTFIRALEHTRDNARDLWRPVATITQVQTYMDHHCNNSTDRRMLSLFLRICNDLQKLCRSLETVHPGDSVSNGILERCKLLLDDNNDFSAIRATYPHSVVQRLSYTEAQNRYGGVVSLFPIILDHLREWVAYTKK
ncbi:Uncharacterized protein C9orf9, partial [Acanthisitta chloris]